MLERRFKKVKDYLVFERKVINTVTLLQKSKNWISIVTEAKGGKWKTLRVDMTPVDVPTEILLQLIRLVRNQLPRYLCRYLFSRGCSCVCIISTLLVSPLKRKF